MICDFLNNVMTKIPTLAFHTMTLCENVIVIYGGINRDKIMGDVHILKFDGLHVATASYEKNTKTFPTPRHSHTALYDEIENKIYFFGGYGEEYPYFLNQLSIMSINKGNSFTFLNSKITEEISQRCRHTSFLNNRKIYIYGGYGIHHQTKKKRKLFFKNIFQKF